MLYRPGFKFIAFPACVAAVCQAELVTVKRTDNISPGIYPSLCHYCPCMRTLIGKSKNFIVVFSQRDNFFIYQDDSRIIKLEINCVRLIGNLEPVESFLHIGDLSKVNIPVRIPDLVQFLHLGKNGISKLFQVFSFDGGDKNTVAICFPFPSFLQLP